jgi:hypothetical protein
MLCVNLEAGADGPGTGAALRYGSGFSKMMRHLAAPDSETLI